MKKIRSVIEQYYPHFPMQPLSIQWIKISKWNQIKINCHTQIFATRKCIYSNYSQVF